MDSTEITRRGFLSRLSLGIAGGVAALAGIPVIGSFLGPLIRRPPQVWRAVGPVDSFTVGKTVAVVFENADPLPWAGVTAKNTAWLRRESETEFIAFALNCTHLGCPVTWLPDAELFMCPCHGGVYTKEGEVVAGPPPKPLTRHPVRIVDGQVEIQTISLPIV